MIVPRCEFGMCALGGRLYALGGWVGEDIGGTIERYDPAADRWTLLAPAMPEPRFSMGIIAHQVRVHINICRRDLSSPSGKACPAIKT